MRRVESAVLVLADGVGGWLLLAYLVGSFLMDDFEGRRGQDLSESQEPL